MTTAKTKKINVLLVEDSPVAQLLLAHTLNSDPHLKVMGTANTGEEALKFLEQNKPDVIVMDIHMSGIDGFQTTRRIMETGPVPIVICTASLDPDEVAAKFRAMEAGAVALVAKPVGLRHHEYEKRADKLVETVRLMSEVKVVKRRPRLRPANLRPAVSLIPRAKACRSAIKIIAIGASTGGPPVLQTILAGLPCDYPIPVLIVQHIAAGFLPGLIAWLNQSTGVPVHIPTHGEAVLPGRAYLAPDGYHMGLGSSTRIALSRKAPEKGVRPSIGHLFRSVASVCGGGAVGVLLTGMGKDGAEDLKALNDLGAVTIAQDEATSTVHGMAGEAIRLRAARYVLAPENIASMLVRLATKNKV